MNAFILRRPGDTVGSSIIVASVVVENLNAFILRRPGDAVKLNV